ncbi:hypothetical protein MIND_00682600 [Mycena indigotica]|uniref:Uncharacterized protein n=1 Tax=Mycena indigotica TaxID=2126181 RepID=A0A8H6SM59_9AGAR|nr:uncharacterized protein MIND_00682600 [Mycena indigotica]KAF7301181.1 hypothetical protein MIND_00682600 [Mycena indigotica]
MSGYEPRFAASAASVGSNTGLRGHAQAPAGSHFSEGPASTGNASPTQGASAPPAQPKQPFYKTRRFIISQLIIIPLGIVILFVLLFPVVKAVAQLVVNRATLDIQVAAITAPTNNSFMLAMQGNVAHTGFIPASINFQEPVDVTWIRDDGSQIPMGQLSLDSLHARNKRANINQTATPFTIVNETAFSLFSAHLITDQNFTWRLESSNLRVQAAKFPVSKGIKFKKDITMKGFNSFSGNVAIQEFQLPSDNPAGGIDFVAVTALSNPRRVAFNLNLGTTIFALSYKNVSLGLGTSTNTVIAPGNNTITLRGVLEKHTDPNEIAVISELFTNYLNSKVTPVLATGVSTLQADGSAISWLSAGLKALNLNVPLVPPTPINPINAISIGNFDLAFSQDKPWSPSATSNTVTAALGLPFGFSVSIGQIQNTFDIKMMDDRTVAGLSTPLGASTSKIAVYGPTNITGQVDISINNTNLNSADVDHPTFAAFNKDLTNKDVAPFRLVGHSRAVATLALGTITLDPINVNVTTSLKGLQGLKGMVTIGSVDVQGGTTDGITLGIQVSINNPSNLKLAIGDLTLNLLRDGANIGTAVIPNLTLNMGVNNVTSKSTFKANASPQGLQTLNDFVGGKDVQLSIAGFDQSTKVASLADALGSIDVSANLPALKTKLLDTAALEILTSTGRSSNISHVTVSLANPFTTPLQITSIKSTVSAFGINLGTIDSKTGFASPGKATTKSPPLELNMNVEPSTLFSLTRRLALEAGLNVDPLDQIVQIGGISYLPAAATGSSPIRRHFSRDTNVFTGFNLPNFVQAAFKKLQSDVELTAGVNIGDYATSLTYSQTGLPTNTDDTLNLILPVLAQPIVQKLVGGSKLGLDTILIKNPAQEAFTAQLKGAITNAGPFDASIAFAGQGLTVNWNGGAIGHIKMDPLKVVADAGATLDTSSTFSVADAGRLTDFTKALLTQESFDWQISGDNLTVSALGIDVTSISAAYSVSLKGFNGLKGGVVIKTFDLPSDDPAGGIHLTLDATAANPSQVGIELSSLSFDTFASDTKIASVSTGSVTLAPGATSQLALTGRLLPQSSAEGLAVVSDVFNRFVQGQNSDVVVHGVGAGSSSVTWLNDGIKALQVATVLPNQGKLTVIKSISLNQLTLAFTESTAYGPLASTSNTEAAFTLPFAFPIDITSLQQTIHVGYQGNDIAQLAIPQAPAKTDVGSRIIHLTFEDVAFAAADGMHSQFDGFVADTTVGNQVTLKLSGSAAADARTAVGVLALKGIDFSVDSTIAGLQGLNARPITVANLDVKHGFSDYLLITVDSALFNPSNLTIGTGDVSFNLQFQDQTIGSADLAKLVITPGNRSYPIEVHYAPQGSSALTAGKALLQNYIQGVNSDTAIGGSTSSTPIQSLKQALSKIHLSPVTIPALHQNLIRSASIKFPTNIVQTGIAQATFILDNPFTASINLLKVNTVATFHGVPLGTIDADVSANPIHADGHGSVTSSPLPLKFNLNPLAIIGLLTTLAQENNVNLGPLIPLFQYVVSNPDIKTTVTTAVDLTPSTCVSGQQFDFAAAILTDLKNLKADLAVQSGLKLDDYATDLSFSQKTVPIQTDMTALFLIGAVAAPVAQHLVDGANLAFSQANITNISDEGFDLSLQGSITNIGPLDATITFVDPLTVTWEGQNIAQIALPPVCVAANTGLPNYSTKARLTITNSGAFTEFATKILHDAEFTWTVTTPKLRLQALGTIFDNVQLTKDLKFKAFNNLPGVTISNFQLPSDDPAGGIHIETDSLIPSTAQLGLDLGTVTFSSSFQGVEIGPLAASNLFLAPTATTKTHLTGRITPKSGSDLDTIGVLFSNYLAGKNQTLAVSGQSVQPSGSSGPVAWLSAAFKTLTLDVTLPGQTFTVINAITINQIALTMVNQDQASAALSSSDNTLAKYKNPFGFSLQVVEAGEELLLSELGLDIARLSLPMAPVDAGVSTGNEADLHITFKDQPLTAATDSGYQLLLAVALLTPSTQFVISGNANVFAKTTIGNVPISGIPFNVDSTIVGINSFNNKATLADVAITGSGGAGGSEFIVVPLTTTLQNPSNISLKTVDISLPVIYQGVSIGRAAIKELDLVPGENKVATEFHYGPADANNTVAQAFVTNFIQGNAVIPLAIQGDLQSTPFASLAPALSSLALSTGVPGLGQAILITHINVYITLESLVTNIVSIDFDFQNPLDTEITIKHIQVDSGLNGIIYAFVTTDMDFTIPAHGTANSGNIGNVLLTQGAIASLAIIPEQKLDLFAASTVQVGKGGYTLPWLKITESSVPTAYSLQLGLAAMQKAATTIAASSSAALASSAAVVVSSAVEVKSQDNTNTQPTKAPEAQEPAESKPAVVAASNPAPVSSAAS